MTTDGRSIQCRKFRSKGMIVGCFGKYKLSLFIARYESACFTAEMIYTGNVIFGMNAVESVGSWRFRMRREPRGLAHLHNIASQKGT